MSASAGSSSPSPSPGPSPSPPPDDEKLEGPIICPGHSRQITDLQFSRLLEDERFFLASACVDNKPMLRDGISGDWIGTLEGHKGAVYCCRLDHDAERVVTASTDYSVKLWDATTGDLIHSWDGKNPMRTSIFTRDCSRVIAGGFDKRVLIYDLKSPSTSALEAAGHSGIITHAALTPDVNIFLTAGKENNVFVWDMRTMTPVKQLATEGKISHLSSSLDHSVAVCSSGKRDVHFWDCKTLTLLKHIPLKREVECVCFDPASGRFLVGGGADQALSIYSFETGAEIASLKGHHGAVTSFALSPSGSTFASGSDDATIRIWEWPK